MAGDEASKRTTSPSYSADKSHMNLMEMRKSFQPTSLYLPPFLSHKESTLWLIRDPVLSSNRRHGSAVHVPQEQSHSPSNNILIPPSVLD